MGFIDTDPTLYEPRPAVHLLTLERADTIINAVGSLGTKAADGVENFVQNFFGVNEAAHSPFHRIVSVEPVPEVVPFPTSPVHPETPRLLGGSAISIWAKAA